MQTQKQLEAARHNFNKGILRGFRTELRNMMNNDVRMSDLNRKQLSLARDFINNVLMGWKKK